MRRWGQITEAKPDAWYLETAKKVYRSDIYLAAAKALIAEGKAKEADFPLKSDGFKGSQDGFIDGIVFDGRKPNDYLGKFKIGLKNDDAA
jgi:nitrate/nitrite transport system substrate-binding protein